MSAEDKDIAIVRKLAAEFLEVAKSPKEEEKRKLWSAHHSLKKTRPLIIAEVGIWNAWCLEEFGDAKMECEDPFYRNFERFYKMQLFQNEIGDDRILEPWVTLHAVRGGGFGFLGDPWGLSGEIEKTDDAGGAWKHDAPLKDWADMAKLKKPQFPVDKEATQKNYERLYNAIGDIIEIDLQYGLPLSSFAGDISTTIAGMRGLEQIMLDMYIDPDKYTALLEFLRDGILEAQNKAEENGEITLTCSAIQTCPYIDELEWIKPNSGPRKRKDIWGFMASQEYTLISPEFHEKFLLDYQKPIMEPFGFIHYGCCENLTEKIDMLRTVPNLRSIAVTPSADVHKCAEQIKNDYVISWRPSPADMVCTDWNEERIRNILKDGMDACGDYHYHIYLKDVETVQGEPDRLKRWVDIVREEIS
jgi:hypothetical protein